MSRTLIHVADRVINRPLLIHPAKAEVIIMAIRDRIGVEVDDATLDADLAHLVPSLNEFVGSRKRTQRDWGMTPAFNGVAIVTIAGSLVNRGAWIGNSSGLVSYEGVGAQIRDAANDPEISSIVLDIESYGGEAGGNNALAELIRTVRSEKPVIAVVNDVAASGGYGIAAAANEIIVSPTSMVGSIGVVMLHLDVSAEMEKKGQVATLIYAGAHKVDGHPFAPLPKSVRDDLQAEVSGIYEAFVSSVAAGRGMKMSAAAIRATEARTFRGEEAITAGLADRVGTFDDVISELSATPRRQSRTMPTRRNSTMANADQTISMTEHDRLTAAAVATARTEGEAAGIKAGSIAERVRIKSILTHAEAAGREASAIQMACETDMSADAASKVLATIPKVASTIAARAAGPEFGSDPKPGQSQPAAEQATTSWNNALERRKMRGGVVAR